MANETIIRRYQGNPIITASAVEGANSIFNSAVVPFGKGYAGVFRVDKQDQPFVLHAGFSDDGLNWKIDSKRINIKGELPEKMDAGRGYDPRVTKIGDTYYVTWCYYPDGGGPCIGLGSTKDFKIFKQLAADLLPYNRNAVLFPRKIKGQYAILHRPSDTGHTPYGDIYYATGPDLIHWGRHKLLMRPKEWWESAKIGAGPTPIETKDGWLLIYHGVRITCSGYIYCGGTALLDLDEPWKLKYRCKRYLIAPTEIYETTGDVPNVVFPTATLLDEKTRELRIYYGSADTTVGVAMADIDELIAFTKKYGKL